MKIIDGTEPISYTCEICGDVVLLDDALDHPCNTTTMQLEAAPQPDYTALLERIAVALERLWEVVNSISEELDANP
jgi:hypothetical protein